MKKILFFLLVATAFIYGQKLTLQQSLELGLKDSREVKIAKIRERIADYQTEKVLSQFFPKLFFQSSYLRLSEVPPFEIKVPLFPAPVKVQDSFLNYYNFKIGFQVPVFLGFKLTSMLTATKENLKAAELNYSIQKNEKAFEIIKSFWNLRKAELSVRLVEKSFERLKVHLKEVESFYNNGSLIKNDYLRMKLKVDEVKVKKEEALSLLKLARTMFNKAVGLNLMNKTEIEPEKIVPAKPTENVEDLIAKGLKQRKELQVMKKKLNVAKENISAAQSAWFPSVSAFGNFYYNRPNQRYLPMKDEYKDSWDVGVSLNWTIFDWLERNSDVETAKEKFQIEKLNLDVFKENIKSQIIADFLNVKNSYEKIKSYKLAVKSAEENLRVTEKLFKEATVRVSDVIDAEAELLKAETNYEMNLIDFEISRIKLNKAVGRKIY